MARAGELTAQKFEELNNTDIDGIEEFKQELEDIGETDTARVVRSIINEVERLDKEANNSGNSIDDLTNKLEKFYEILDKIVSKQEKLSELFNKIRLGSSLTAKEVYELSKEMPNIFKYLEPTSDGGYTLSTEGFNALSNENIDAEKDKLQKSISETKTQIALLGSLQKAALEVENSGGKDKGLIFAIAATRKMMRLAALLLVAQRRLLNTKTKKPLLSRNGQNVLRVQRMR